MGDAAGVSLEEPGPRAGLYTSSELFAGWDPDRPASAAQTYDFRVYAAARRHGKAALRSPPRHAVARARAVHDGDMIWHLNQRLAGDRVVAVMGGHRMARGDDDYRLVAHLGRSLADTGVLPVSGGGPGAMEATHLGARTSGSGVSVAEALAVIVSGGEDTLVFPFDSADELFVDGRWDQLHADNVERLHRWLAPAFALAEATAGRPGASIGVPTWLYGHEPPTPLATEHAKYFDNSIREDGLLAVATAGVVFAPGRAGTLQEIFQDAAQNYYESVADRFSPMVFLDVDGYWTDQFSLRPVLEELFDPAQRENVHWVTDVEAAVAALS